MDCGFSLLCVPYLKIASGVFLTDGEEAGVYGEGLGI